MEYDLNTRIGVDSHCLTYLIDAMEGVSEPIDKLTFERKALIRLYLYLPGTLYITPTVLTECAAIRNVDRRHLHAEYSNVLFDEIFIEDKNHVDILAKSYNMQHKGAKNLNDCRILAEALNGGLQILTTYDGNFISKLRSKVNEITLDRPSMIWKRMKIPRGAKPHKRPSNANPMSNEDWWRW